jgi:hypothetical protein
MQNSDNQKMVIFKNSIYKDKKNNIETFIISLQNVKKFKVWNYNRTLDNIHWKNIYKYQKKYYEENKTFNFTSILTIANYKNNLIIIDGLHRIKAITELCNKYNISDKSNVGNIRVDLITTNNYNTLIDKFKEINFCKPIDATYNEIIKLEKIEEFLKFNFKVEKKSEYKNKKGEIKNRILTTYIIKDSKIKPYLSRKKVMDKFKKSHILLSLSDKIIFDLIKEINEEYSKSDDILKLTQNQMNTMYIHNCFLGLNNNWIDELENKVANNINKYIL